MLWVGLASAFTIGSSLSGDCHEGLAGAALRAVREDGTLVAPSSTNAADHRWIDELPFVVPADLADAEGAALLAGSRDPDLMGAAPTDVATLTSVHGDSEHQYAHCLRSSTDDGADGDATALAGCREEILEEVDAALDGLDASGLPDDAVRTNASIWLTFSGTRDVPVPATMWHLGRALHTLQDAYAHTLRDDTLAVTGVLNFVDFADEHLDPERDGAAHLSAMDQCQSEGLPAERSDAAALASEALVRAVLDPALSKDERRAAAAAVLDDSLRLQTGCTADNQWCDAGEFAVGSGCDSGRGAPFGLGVLFALGAVTCRRASRPTLMLFAVLLGLAAPRVAAAKSPRVPLYPASWQDVGIEGRLGGSVDHLAGAAALGVRWRLSDRFVLGIDGEINPWGSAVTNDIVSGCTNLMIVGTREYPIGDVPVRLAFSVRAGLSRLNMTVYGAREGSLGPAIGVSALGIVVDMRRGWTLIFEPDDVEIPVPHITGVPLAWAQYRMTVGVRWGAAIHH